MALSVGCSEADAGPHSATPGPGPSTAGEPGVGSEGRVGSLSFSLETRDGNFESFSYAITGPSFAKSGTIEVSKSNHISALIEGIPIGSDYTVTLSGQSVGADQVVCSGSAGFEIEAGAVTSAVVPVSCHLAQQPAEPSEPTAAPLPPFSPVLVGVALLVMGVCAARRPRRV
jgi:hypothetical protein